MASGQAHHSFRCDASFMKNNPLLRVAVAGLSFAFALAIHADVPPDSQKPASPGEKPGAPTVPGNFPGNGSDVPTVPARPGTPGEKPTATPPPNPPGNNGNK
jgi:hypothetical protein